MRGSFSENVDWNRHSGIVAPGADVVKGCVVEVVPKLILFSETRLSVQMQKNQRNLANEIYDFVVAGNIISIKRTLNSLVNGNQSISELLTQVDKDNRSLIHIAAMYGQVSYVPSPITIAQHIADGYDK